MPDRYGEDPDPVPDEVWSAEQRRLHAIKNCSLCNSDGIRGDFTRCDHRDYGPAAVRGRAAVNQAMGWEHQNGEKTRQEGAQRPGKDDVA